MRLRRNDHQEIRPILNQEFIATMNQRLQEILAAQPELGEIPADRPPEEAGNLQLVHNPHRYTPPAINVGPAGNTNAVIEAVRAYQRNRAIETRRLVQDIIEQHFNELIIAHFPTTPQQRPGNIAINGGQSSHTASVHQSTSESAAKLRDSYGILIDGPELESVIEQIRYYVNQLPDDSLKNQAAKRCIERITAPDYTFTDPRSDISTRQLLALTFLAIHNSQHRDAELNDARALFVEGLYEIQRGYNLSEDNIDDHDPDDRPICVAGTFNKLIEKLSAIHTDCQILFITKDTALLKLRVVAKEEAINHLKAASSTSNGQHSSEFQETIKALEDGDLSAIWDKIEALVANRIFDEFRTLYNNDREDTAFKRLIDGGKSFELTSEDLEPFKQRSKQNSRSGYTLFSAEAQTQNTDGQSSVHTLTGP